MLIFLEKHIHIYIPSRKLPPILSNRNSKAKITKTSQYGEVTPQTRQLFFISFKVLEDV